MKYRDVLKHLAQREGRPQQELEQDMAQALRAAGFEGTVEEFIEMAVSMLTEKDDMS